ncbi:hypothetical protein [Murimonas intestini]|uniref:hypothetical protein n=1 Tax=Murimonas intestini TaxID=1337051 RepID=UPI00248C1B86|nr:hypothetical protein [Murimonas intestini]
MDIEEGIKKVLLAGIGAATASVEVVKDIANTLVEKGEAAVSQGKVINEEQKRDVKEKVKDHVTVNIVKEYKDAMNAVDHMTAEELEALKEKIEAAEKAAEEKAAKEKAKKAEKEAKAAEAEKEAANQETCAAEAENEAAAQETCAAEAENETAGQETCATRAEDEAADQEENTAAEEAESETEE